MKINGYKGRDECWRSRRIGEFDKGIRKGEISGRPEAEGSRGHLRHEGITWTSKRKGEGMKHMEMMMGCVGRVVKPQ